MLQAGLPSLHYHCTVVLHSCIVLPSVGHSSNHEYNCCQLTRQSSCVSSFYRTFKVFIWSSLVFAKIYKPLQKKSVFVSYFKCLFVQNWGFHHSITIWVSLKFPVHLSQDMWRNTRLLLWDEYFDKWL
jgi:hypothetical protein